MAIKQRTTARARLQDARAVEQLLEGYRRSRPSPYWVGARAGRGRSQFRESVDRLFEAAVGSRDPRLLDALTELCHDSQLAPGDAGVNQLDDPIRRDQQVGRLEVPVHHQPGIGLFQGPADLDRDLDRHLRTRAPSSS